MARVSRGDGWWLPDSRCADLIRGAEPRWLRSPGFVQTTVSGAVNRRVREPAVSTESHDGRALGLGVARVVGATWHPLRSWRLVESRPGKLRDPAEFHRRKATGAPGRPLEPPGYGPICWPISPSVSPRARARSRRVDSVGHEPSPRSMTRIVRRETSARADSRAIDSHPSLRACWMTRASRIDISSRLGGSIVRSNLPAR